MVLGLHCKKGGETKNLRIKKKELCFLCLFLGDGFAEDADAVRESEWHSVWQK